jgi:hypothetical protein
MSAATRMPSDAKKKQQQKKKEAAKARQAGRKATGSNKTENGSAEKEQSPAPDQLEMNGSGENGTDVSIEGKPLNVCYQEYWSCLSFAYITHTWLLMEHRIWPVV